MLHVNWAGWIDSQGEPDGGLHDLGLSCEDGDLEELARLVEEAEWVALAHHWHGLPVIQDEQTGLTLDARKCLRRRKDYLPAVSLN